MNTNDDCIVTDEDHQEGLEYMKRTQFYKTLSSCIDKEDKDD